MDPTSTLDSFPEELLERILSFSVPSRAPISLPPSAHAHKNRHTGSGTGAGKRAAAVAEPAFTGLGAGSRSQRLSPLFISRKFHRISEPLFYSTLYLSSSSTSPSQITELLATLRERPELGNYVHSIYASGCVPGLGEVMELCCRSVKTIDICIEPPPATTAAGTNAEQVSRDSILSFCRALRGMERLEMIVLRKANGLYLTTPPVRFFINQLAEALKEGEFDQLKSFYLAFRPSDDAPARIIPSSFAAPPSQPVHAPSTSPVASLLSQAPHALPASASRPASPLVNLTKALATLPNLQLFISHLPSVWNEVLLGLTGEGQASSLLDEEDEADNSHLHSQHHHHYYRSSATATASPRLSPALRKIILLPGTGSATPGDDPANPGSASPAGISVASFAGRGMGPAPRGLYMSSAKKYARFWALLQAGYQPVPGGSSTGMGPYAAARGRAWTWAGAAGPSGQGKA